MSEFHQIKYSNLQGWIPESDIDGIDAKLDFLSEAINIDFENGFIKPAIAPSSSALPTPVDNAVNVDGYTIIVAKRFIHSTQGECVFYILSKSAIDYLFYVNSTLLTVNNLGSNPTLSSAITLLDTSFAFINDQLKINTNRTATLLGMASIKMNLSLEYLTAPTTSPFTSAGTAGWYLMVRWLGWQTQTSADMIVSRLSSNTIRTTITETCADITPESWLTLTGISEHPTDSSWWATDLLYGRIVTSNLINVKNMSVELSTYGDGDYALIVIYRASAPSEILVEKRFEHPLNQQKVEIEINLLANDIIIDINLYNSCWIRNININAFPPTEYCVVGKYQDGQRGLFQEQVYGVDLLEDSYLKVYNTKVDARIYSYELYAKINEVFYLVSEILATHSGWAPNAFSGAGWYAHIIAWTAVEDLVDTLTFNYGLGATVRVDTQHTIYDEVSHKGRSYCVNDTFRILHSHLSATAKIQPDSFPYNETNYFGFFELPLSEKAMALAITPLDELMILTTTKSYVYYIQSGQGVSFKRIKSVNGSAGIGSRKSLIKDISGLPDGEIIAWTDKNGVYIHAGGLEAAVDIALRGGIKNWWRTQTYTSTTIGVYNPIRKELWFTFGGSSANDTILIYEIEFGRFRKYNFGEVIKCFAGFSNNNLYYITTNSLKYHNYDGSTRLGITLATHYNSGVAWVNGRPAQLGEDDYKVLQEFFVSMNNIDGTVDKTLIVYCFLDGGNIMGGGVGDILYLTPYKYQDKMLTPLGTQFRKIKIYIRYASGKLTSATIREFGVSFSTFERGLAQ